MHTKIWPCLLPCPAGCSQDRRRLSVITAEISSAGLHSFAHQEAPAQATAVDVSVDAAPPSSSASQPPSPLPPERLTVQDGNHGCGTDYCPQIKKKRDAPLLFYFSLPHRLCLTAILVFSAKMQWFSSCLREYILPPAWALGPPPTAFPCPPFSYAVHFLTDLKVAPSGFWLCCFSEASLKESQSLRMAVRSLCSTAEGPASGSCTCERQFLVTDRPGGFMYSQMNYKKSFHLS